MTRNCGSPPMAVRRVIFLAQPYETWRGYLTSAVDVVVDVGCGIDTDPPPSALYYAAALGRADLVRKLVEHGANTHRSAASTCSIDMLDRIRVLRHLWRLATDVGPC